MNQGLNILLLPFKRIRPGAWILIFGVWTLAALSLSIQIYFSKRHTHPDLHPGVIFLKQLVPWTMCSLFTPVVIHVYNRHPLHTPEWKKNIFKHIFIAFLLFTVFSNLRLGGNLFAYNTDTSSFTMGRYLSLLVSQMAWDTAIYALIATGTFAYSVNTQKNKQEQRNLELNQQLTQSRLEALRWQLNPHFLFNSLNTINGLIRSGKNEDAIHVTTKLGDFLRATLSENSTSLVPLEKELAFARLYLNIEMIRFKDRLVVREEIEDGCAEAMVPYLLLQPVIENAVKHGIAKSVSAKLIAIHAVMEKEHLRISVFNEGEQFPIGDGGQTAGGIGLKNISDRLKTIYKNGYDLKITNDAERKGTVTSILIPAKLPGL